MTLATFQWPEAHSPDAVSSMWLDRAVTELRHGRLLVLAPQTDGQPVLMAAVVETLSQARWSQWQTVVPHWRVLLTAERLHALGRQQVTSSRSLSISPQASLSDLQALAGVDQQGSVPMAFLGDERVTTSVDELVLLLAKRARLAPALVVAQGPSNRVDAQAGPWLTVREGDVAQALRQSPMRLQRVSDAPVPLAVAEQCKLVLFREVDTGAEHVAIVVGQPDFKKPVPVRLHSSCLTGDLLGSLRCDCGDQLKRAMDYLAGSGGVLLYLSQEGRGTGLANKLRAYRLQDSGLDTIDADRYLGFTGEERDFRPAACMLKALGVVRVSLLTNNPKKMDALRSEGIEVVERLALAVPTNPHNERYFQTKRDRAGHLFGDDEQDEHPGS